MKVSIAIIFLGFTNLLYSQSAESLYRKALATENKSEKFELFSKSIEKNPQISCPFLERGQFCYFQKNYKQAILDFQKAIELNNWKYSKLYYRHSLRDSYEYLIKSFFSLERYSDALPVIEDGINFLKNSSNEYDGDSDFYGDKIIALVKLKQFKEAQIEIENYRVPNSSISGVDWNRAFNIHELDLIIKENLNDYNGALTKSIPRLEGYSSVYSGTHKSHYFDFLKGKFKYLMGSYKRSLEDLNRSISSDNNYALAYYYRALVKIKLNDTQNAIEDINEALSIEPSNSLLHELKTQIMKENTTLNEINSSQQTRSIASDSRFENENVVKPNGKYYALLIGCSNYDNPKLNLNRPEIDAVEFMRVLTSKYLFDESEIKILKSPTRSDILGELFRLRKLITSNDNLLIFYAGHGYWDKETKQGYWWPRDGQIDNPSNWLSNSDLVEQIRAIKSGHTLLISDACFSGGIFKQRDVSTVKNASLDIQLLYKLPSRRAMTSTSLTKVNDDSEFIKYLLKRLNENNQKFLSSEQLFDSFKQAVISNSLNIPQDGEILNTGHEGGDFIFIKRE